MTIAMILDINDNRCGNLFDPNVSPRRKEASPTAPAVTLIADIVPRQ